MKKGIKVILRIIVAIVIILIILLAIPATRRMIVGNGAEFMANVVAPIFFKHKDVSKETAAYTMAATDLYNAFKSDTATANKKYGGQVVLVSGTIMDIDSTTYHVSLDSNSVVVCAIDSTDIPKIGAHKIGDPVKIQGLIAGYNPLLDDVDVSQCTFK